MKITVLDGYAVNPGDMSWDALKELGEVTVYDRTPHELVQERSRGADVLLTNKTVITREDIAALPQLRYIGVLATGYNVVDVQAAAEAGVTVTNIPAYSTMSVAQQIFALILALTNRVEHYTEENSNGRWSECADFSYADTPLHELAGKRMGIVGYGHIGRATARIAAAFGMEVSVASSKPQEDIPEVRKESIDDLFRHSDVLCLCCPLTENNAGMVNRDTLSLMKPSAILINTARGGLVNEADLVDALNSGRLAGAGVDVLSSEPPKADNPLLAARNCMITPHVAWATYEARQRLMKMAADNLRAFAEEKPINVVNAPK